MRKSYRADGPRISRISCGSAAPSVRCWPLCTTSPGCTMMCLPVAIRCSSSCWVSSFFTTSLRLPRWVGSAFGEVLAFVHDVTGLHDDVLAGGDQMLLFLLGLVVFHDELALAEVGRQRLR